MNKTYWGSSIDKGVGASLVTQLMNSKSRQDEIVAQFSILDTWEQRYKLVIELGKKLAAYPEEFRNPDHLVRGCQSQVWLHAELKDGKVLLWGDSDAVIVKGLVSLLIDLYSGLSPQEVLSTSPEFINRLDFSSHLSPSRANGLFAMVKQIKFYALAFQARQSTEA